MLVHIDMHMSQWGSTVFSIFMYGLTKSNNLIELLLSSLLSKGPTAQNCEEGSSAGLRLAGPLFGPLSALNPDTRENLMSI